ncbi:hypothetical protein EPIR_3053 [Erwinia piriflorinigrans CFBP 5888]|uniref:Uncharacterized protein n=1 Tax=Erwinia piriflorinigrans CFBP 5888 TaxID=1161919 RepID=V5ZAL1_9GAMM|nr:hypothetical protein EPIR_3053 [Erwinia piriflorinigrans CFBP 5888]
MIRSNITLSLKQHPQAGGRGLYSVALAAGRTGVILIIGNNGCLLYLIYFQHTISLFLYLQQ